MHNKEYFFKIDCQYILNPAGFYASCFFPQQQKNKNQNESPCDGKSIGFAPSQNLAVFGSCVGMACPAKESFGLLAALGKKGGFVSFAKTKERKKFFSILC